VPERFQVFTDIKAQVPRLDGHALRSGADGHDYLLFCSVVVSSEQCAKNHQFRQFKPENQNEGRELREK
jgi:hypothetical protein